MFDLPINAITWTLGSVALYTVAFNSWRAYRRTGNLLTRMYVALGLSFGTALFFYGVPGLLTESISLLRPSYFLADLFAQVSLQVQLWILWFIGLRGHVRLKSLFMVTVPFSAVLVTLQGLTSQVTVSQSPHLILFTDDLPVSIMKSIIYLAIPLPLGYFFLRQVPKQVTGRAKIKSFTLGLIFMVVALAATSNNIFDRGRDTVESATVVMVFFAVFLLVQLLRPRPPKPA